MFRPEVATPDERIGLLDVDMISLSGLLLAPPWVLGELKMMCLSFTISKIMKHFYSIVLRGPGFLKRLVKDNGP